MTDAMLRRSRRAATGRMAAAALQYAAMGWPVCVGAHLPAGRGRRCPLPPPRMRRRGDARACSCDRVGCPAPGAHPLSPAWQLEASTDPVEIARWWAERPAANVILVTGRVFDVLDIPAAAGLTALARLDAAGVKTGPVELTCDDRALFFVATRGAPADEQEWWSCHLDCEPDSFAPVAGLRWHCRDSYVVAPPSRCGRGMAAQWIRDPKEHPALPDALRPLEFLADASDEVVR